MGILEFIMCLIITVAFTFTMFTYLMSRLEIEKEKLKLHQDDIKLEKEKLELELKKLLKEEKDNV
jgi:hypothetical protein